MGGHDHCAVYGCNHRRDKQLNICGFYEFPKQTSVKSRWIHASGRQDLTLKSVSSYTKICGCHFVSGKPARRNKDNVDFVPTRKLPTTLLTNQSEARRTKTSCKSREWSGAVAEAVKEGVSAVDLPKRSRRKLAYGEVPPACQEIEIPSLADLHEEEERHQSDTVPQTQAVSESFIVDMDHNYTDKKYENSSPASSTSETQTDNNASDNDNNDVKIKQYKLYVAQLKKQLALKEKMAPSFNHHLLKTDKDAMFWTGLPNKKVFMSLFKYLEPKAKNLRYSRTKESHLHLEKLKPGKDKKMPLIDEFFAVLARVKVGLLVPDISSRLGISIGHFSKLFEKWIRFLRRELEDITRFPLLHEIKKHMPDSFGKYPNTRVIIDCTELFCQKPSSMKSQRQLWSNYKHHNTYKALVGVTPDGSVAFISNLYGGSCSDKFITKDCGILNHLQHGDCVMADRGFQIEDLLPTGVQLNIPPFLDSKAQQLTAEQVEETRRIASVRIHVERAIQRIKIFHILDGVMPLTLHHVAEDIFKVCSYLTNFQTPIIAQ